MHWPVCCPKRTHGQVPTLQHALQAGHATRSGMRRTAVPAPDASCRPACSQADGRTAGQALAVRWLPQSLYSTMVAQPAVVKPRRTAVGLAATLRRHVRPQSLLPNPLTACFDLGTSAVSATPGAGQHSARAGAGDAQPMPTAAFQSEQQLLLPAAQQRVGALAGFLLEPASPLVASHAAGGLLKEAGAAPGSAAVAGDLEAEYDAAWSMEDTAHPAAALGLSAAPVNTHPVLLPAANQQQQQAAVVYASQAAGWGYPAPGRGAGFEPGSVQQQQGSQGYVREGLAGSLASAAAVCGASPYPGSVAGGSHASHAGASMHSMRSDHTMTVTAAGYVPHTTSGAAPFSQLGYNRPPAAADHGHASHGLVGGHGQLPGSYLAAMPAALQASPLGCGPLGYVHSIADGHSSQGYGPVFGQQVHGHDVPGQVQGQGLVAAGQALSQQQLSFPSAGAGGGPGQLSLAAPSAQAHGAAAAEPAEEEEDAYDLLPPASPEGLSWEEI
ncbi:hypothetical protein V8C86DRAFT_831178 [Haematococcus lacustris]